MFLINFWDLGKKNDAKFSQSTLKIVVNAIKKILL